MTLAFCRHHVPYPCDWLSLERFIDTILCIYHYFINSTNVNWSRVRRFINVDGNFFFAIICLIIGAYCYSSYGYHVDWYNQWCSGDMASLQLLNAELHQECREVSSKQFIYQIGYILSFGLSIISVIWAVLYPIMNPIDEDE